jgi:hypothetical protein
MSLCAFTPTSDLLRSKSGASRIGRYVAHTTLSRVAKSGNLAERHAWLEWNLADPVNRQREIDSAIHTIRELAIPYFAVFDNPANVCSKLMRGELVGMDLMNMFDFVACFSSIAAAREVAVAYLSRRADLIDGYRERLKQFQQTGLPDHVPSGYVDVLAALSVRFDLGDLGAVAIA